ncbi:MAG: hypothetical protein AABX13_05930 [Nanoarchaeota archaeon]
MGERRLVIDHLKFSYDGLFNVNELYSVISGWFFEKGYDWHEHMNQELVTTEGRQVRLILEPWKSVTQFYKLIVNIHLNLIDLKGVEVEHKGQTVQLSQGTVRMTIDGYVMSDRSGAWTRKPLYWFFTMVGQKYFFRDHFARMEAWLKSDVDDMYNKVKNYLNVMKYTYQG